MPGTERDAFEGYGDDIIEVDVREALFSDGTFYYLDSIEVATRDDYGFLEDWSFTIKEMGAYGEEVFDYLQEGEMGIAFLDTGLEFVDVVYKRWYPVFDNDDPTFAGGNWDCGDEATDTCLTYKISSPSLATSETEGLAALYGDEALNKMEQVATIEAKLAELGERVALGTAASAQTFKKIKQPQSTADAFNVFETEETSQSLSISTVQTTTY